MTYNVSINGTPFPLPSQSERNWAAQVNAFFVAIGQSLLQKSGGSFTLSAEVDFGSSFGLAVAYLKSKTQGSGSIASAGWGRLTKIDRIAFRNISDSADIPIGLHQGTGRLQAGSVFQFYGDTSDVINLQPLSAEKNSGRIPSVGEKVQVQSFAGTGLTVGATYWVTDVSGYTIKLYTTEGGPTYADITAAGLGYLVIQDDVLTSASVDTIKNKTAFDLAYDSEVGTISGESINTTSGKVVQRITSSTPNFVQINQPTAGKVYVFVNETGSDITIKHNAGTATRAIYTPGGVDITWKPNQAVNFLYDSGLSAWVMVGGAGGGSGAGSGEINAISNPSGAENTTGWTGVTRNTTNSPLSPIVSSCLAIANTATTETSTSGGYFPISSLPSGIRGRRLKVEFYYSTPATDNYAVSVWKGTTRIPLTTDASGATNLPKNTIGKFYAEFDADSSASSYTPTVTRTSGSTGPAYITNVIIGPGLQVQGPMLAKWEDCTMTSNWTNTITAKRRIVGSNMEYHLNAVVVTAAAADLIFTLPTDDVIDTSSLSSNSSLSTILGNGRLYDVGTMTYAASVVYANTTQFRVGSNSGGANLGLVNNSYPFGFVTGDIISLTLSVPLTRLANGSTVNLLNQQTQSPIKAGIIMPFAGATVPAGWLECDGSTYAQTAYPDLYATLGSTWATCTNPLTGSAYSAPTAGNFRVPDLRGTFLRGVGTFSDGIGTDTSLAGYQADQMQGHYHNTPIQFSSVNDAGTNFPLLNQGTAEISGSVTGPITDGTNGTPRTGKETRPRNVGVKYIIKAWNESFNLAGFAEATATQMGLVQGGRLPGQTSGATIEQYKIGEKVTWTSTPSTQLLTTSEADWTNASIALTAGVWLIMANISVSATPNNVAGANGTAVVKITDSSNTLLQNMDKQLFVTNPAAGVIGSLSTLGFSCLVNISGSTTYKIRVFKGEASSTCNVYNQSNARSEFFAVRIA